MAIKNCFFFQAANYHKHCIPTIIISQIKMRVEKLIADFSAINKKKLVLVWFICLTAY